LGSILPIQVPANQAFNFGIKPGVVVARLSGLWLALPSLALFEPIAVAVQFEDVDVVGRAARRSPARTRGDQGSNPSSLQQRNFLRH
jgi:hypothetical protein